MLNAPYRSRRAYYLNACAAAGTVCNNPPTTLRINGQRVQSQYCHYHACKQIEGGRACSLAKLPRDEVCRQHIRCQAVDSGTRCGLEVKDGNTAMHRYCTQLHLCEFSGCQSPRSRRNNQYFPYCDDHQCEYDSCRNPKDTGVFCRSHTCDERYCNAFAPGTDLDDPQRFCERHRPCQRPQCPRLCHTRDNGQPSPFCGAHYCEAHDCEDGRDGGSYCHAHTCAEPGCFRGKEAPGGQYCREHECRTRNCHLRKIGREFCPYHECVYDGCENEVVEGRLCGRHQQRMDAGFGGMRFPAQGMGYVVYEDGINDRRGSGRRPERAICHIPNCQAPRTRESHFRLDHECPVEGCPRPRYPRHHVFRGGADEHVYDEHACVQPECPMQVVDGSDRCLLHGGGGMPTFRNRMVDGDDGRPGRMYRDNGGRYGQRQRRFGWAEPMRNQWETWGRAM